MVQPIKQIGWEPPVLEEGREFRPRRGEQLVDETLRQGFRRVHEDELLALLLGGETEEVKRIAFVLVELEDGFVEDAFSFFRHGSPPFIRENNSPKACCRTRFRSCGVCKGAASPESWVQSQGL